MVAKAAEIQQAISEGARAFLMTEYKYMGIFGVSQKRCGRGLGPLWVQARQ